ncbi:hypothetical protein Patl1_33415 [Pistacia atlantica]|uniref:Uncharacterized protein n=1 Tax=Pistacia atlantica TaxID=434234 RepID=A0ACC0ZVI3_9ROSI|nr:hypothetical protein Patl1_33415 [Pistacia atlantica]
MKPNQVFNSLNPQEISKLDKTIETYHTFSPSPNTCTSFIKQRIDAPLTNIWPFVRDFANPKRYKSFIKSCKIRAGDGEVIGSIRDVAIISGLPASSSIERLEMLDDEKHILSFKILGGDHRLQNYCSVTSVCEFEKESEEETRSFVNTLVKTNLGKLEKLAMASLKGN